MQRRLTVGGVCKRCVKEGLQSTAAGGFVARDCALRVAAAGHEAAVGQRDEGEDRRGGHGRQHLKGALVRAGLGVMEGDMARLHAEAVAPDAQLAAQVGGPLGPSRTCDSQQCYASSLCPPVFCIRKLTICSL